MWRLTLNSTRTLHSLCTAPPNWRVPVGPDSGIDLRRRSRLERTVASNQLHSQPTTVNRLETAAPASTDVHRDWRGPVAVLRRNTVRYGGADIIDAATGAEFGTKSPPTHSGAWTEPGAMVHSRIGIRTITADDTT